MQKREIAMVALAGLAAVHFGIDHFVVSKPKAPAGERVRVCEDFVTQSRATLQVLEHAPAIEHGLVLLGTNEWSNPFIRDGVSALAGGRSGVQPKSPEHVLKYTGYIESNGKGWALINSKEYVVNDMIELMGLKVVEISREYVVLQPQESGSVFGAEDELIKVAKEVEDELF